MTTQATRTPGVADGGLDALADDQIAELMAGAPESYSEPTGESPQIASVHSGPEPALLEPGAGKVVLRNMRYINEVVFLPVDGEIVGNAYVEFVDGTLITDQATADRVKAICPYVAQEPSEGTVFTYKGFQTRVSSIYEQYVRYWNENNAG